MGRVRLPHSLVSLAALAVCLPVAAACSSGDGTPADPTPTVVQATATQQAGTPVVSPTAAPSSTPSPTPRADGRPAATSAAVAALDARVIAAPLTRDACLDGNPSSQPCIALSSDETTVRGGLAVFAGGYPDAGLFTLVMGRQRDGAWALWFITQQPGYQLTDLPGEALACAEGKLPLRSEPNASAATAGEVERLTRLGVEEFVLVSPGSATNGARGEGWYRIASPVPAWVMARDTAAAERGGCDLRDALENAGSPRG